MGRRTQDTRWWWSCIPWTTSQHSCTPRKFAAAILPQVDREMAWIKGRNHYCHDELPIIRLPCVYSRTQREGSKEGTVGTCASASDGRSPPRFSCLWSLSTNLSSLTNLLEHYPYDYGVCVPKDDLLPHPRFSTWKFDAQFMHLDTEHTDPVKPKS